MAKRVLSQIPPLRENVCTKQADTETAMAMPRTAPFVTSIFDASSIRIAKLIALPAMLPRMMNDTPKRQVEKRTVFSR
jgi:hypothetical protein